MSIDLKESGFSWARDITLLNYESYRSERCAQSTTHSLVRYTDYTKFHSEDSVRIIYLRETFKRIYNALNFKPINQK